MLLLYICLASILISHSSNIHNSASITLSVFPVGCKTSLQHIICFAGVWMLYCMVAYCYVIYSMGKMLQSAITESADASQRQGLLFIYYGTVVIWSAFVVVWFGQELGMLSIYRAELGNMLANFSAKVSSAMCTDSIISTCLALHDFYLLLKLLMLRLHALHVISAKLHTFPRPNEPAFAGAVFFLCDVWQLCDHCST